MASHGRRKASARTKLRKIQKANYHKKLLRVKKQVKKVRNFYKDIKNSPYKNLDFGYNQGVELDAFKRVNKRTSQYNLNRVDMASKQYLKRKTKTLEGRRQATKDIFERITGQKFSNSQMDKIASNIDTTKFFDALKSLRDLMPRTNANSGEQFNMIKQVIENSSATISNQAELITDDSTHSKLDVNINGMGTLEKINNLSNEGAKAIAKEAFEKLNGGISTIQKLTRPKL